MAEIPVQKKTSMGWLWLLLGLIVLALLIWWIAGSNDNDEDLVTGNDVVLQDNAAGVNGGAMADAANPDTTGALTLAQITADPQQYFGRDFSGEVDVGSNLTDRGFWVEQNGNRMFALIIDQPREVPKDINAGQTLRITGGTVHDASSLDDIPGDSLNQNTRKIIADQDAILVVDEANIEILNKG